ncbi:hypothetical protein HK100_004979, partial [Physocladia obscura]
MKNSTENEIVDPKKEDDEDDIDEGSRNTEVALQKCFDSIQIKSNLAFMATLRLIIILKLEPCLTT